MPNVKNVDLRKRKIGIEIKKIPILAFLFEKGKEFGA
jgi:hypothetical protein